MKPMISLNIGWMRRYEGLQGDTIQNGGSYVREHGFGNEICNFKPHQGNLYGFGQVKGTINIERLGASQEDEMVSGVLAIWVARDPSGGTKIVGWYDNATIYKAMQPAPTDSNRKYQGEEFGYMVRAKIEDCVLLSVDQRTKYIPRRQKGGMGQANIWYADKPINDHFKQEVWTYVENKGRNPKKPGEGHRQRIPKHLDPEKRIQIEKIAINKITTYYEELEYTVTSVERDNVGWDLEAELPPKRLLLEVKGLSQKDVSIELTPNEYSQMRSHRDDYRICIVTDTLGTNPIPHIFSYSVESQNWEDEEGKILTITERTGARCQV